MGERFALQYSVPLTIFPGWEPSVSWRPWDFILMFAKPRQGPEAPSPMAPGSWCLTKSIQAGCRWRRVFTGAGWKTELNYNGPQDTALPTSVNAADDCQMMMSHSVFIVAPTPGAGTPQLCQSNECHLMLPAQLIVSIGGTSKGLLRSKGYLEWSKIGLSRLTSVWTGWGGDHLPAFTFYHK